jgi:hypothetical protein
MNGPHRMSRHNGDFAAVTAQLNRMYYLVDHMANLEGQDRALVIEMSQAMLSAVIEDRLGSLVEYVKRYCDVIDSEADAESIVTESEE